LKLQFHRKFTHFGNQLKCSKDGDFEKVPRQGVNADSTLLGLALGGNYRFEGRKK
jgi:hypothetical protein